MHLIMIIIRWLVGFFGGGRLVVRGDWSYAPSEAGTDRFLIDSNGAYYSGVGGMKVSLILAELNGLLGRCPAHAVISPDCRGLLRINPYQPGCSVVETARLCTNFSPPWPHVWG